MEKTRPQVLVLGAGFGGVRASLNLLKKVPSAKVTLISDTPVHCYAPLLYEAATSIKIRHQERDFKHLLSAVNLPLAEIFQGKRIKILIDKVEGINLPENQVETVNFGKLEYDYLVIALGSTTNYFGIKGASEHAHPLKSLTDALRIREDISRLVEQCGKGSTESGLNIVIAGGGFTGVELAGSMSRIVHRVGKVTVIEGSDHLLGGMPRWAQGQALRSLTKSGIEVKFNCLISEVGKDTITCGSGGSLPYRYLIWTTGVKGVSLSKGVQGVVINRRGQIIVGQDLRVPAFPNVLVVGDMAEIRDEKRDGFVPATAWAAIDEGKIAAENIKRAIKDSPPVYYYPPHPAFVVPVGKMTAVSNALGLALKGKLPWLIKLCIAYRYFLEVSAVLRATWLFKKVVWLDIKRH